MLTKETLEKYEGDVVLYYGGIRNWGQMKVFTIKLK